MTTAGAPSIWTEGTGVKTPRGISGVVIVVAETNGLASGLSASRSDSSAAGASLHAIRSKAAIRRASRTMHEGARSVSGAVEHMTVEAVRPSLRSAQASGAARSAARTTGQIERRGQ
jgi:hypothetical protein